MLLMSHCHTHACSFIFITTHQSARGEDTRPLDTDRSKGRQKSVGAEINWGVRFTEQGQAHRFIVQLAGEVRCL